MMTAYVGFVLLAVLFLLAALGIPIHRVNLIVAGMFFMLLTLTLIVAMPTSFFIK